LNRNITVEGCYNVRDLGGYSTADGRSTRWQVFVRAGNLSSMKGEGYRQLTDYGIKTIVDVRDESECIESPNDWVHTSAMHYLNLPLFGDAMSQNLHWNPLRGRHQHLHQHYTYYLDQCQSQIGAIMGAVIESAPGTLFHCWMGKDRTGVIAGLLLGAVGVPAEVIADDYAQTNEHYAPMIPEWRVRAEARGENLAHFDRDVFSLPETMLEMLQHLTAHYGGVTPYIHTCGVPDSQIMKLREQFVE